MRDLWPKTLGQALRLIGKVVVGLVIGAIIALFVLRDRISLFRGDRVALAVVIVSLCIIGAIGLMLAFVREETPARRRR